MAIGLEWVRGRTNSIIHDIGALIIAGLNPHGGDRVRARHGPQSDVHRGEPVGGPFINLILLGYGLPAVLAITLALYAPRPAAGAIA